jgi:hypothetical protein
MQTHQKAYPAAMTGTWDEEMYDVRFYTDSTKTELFELQRYAIGSGKAGVTPAGVPTKAPDANYHHIFKQWDNTTYLNKLTKDVDVYAIYTTGVHSFKEQSDATHHWRECSVCGYVKDKVSHSMGAVNDAAHHWTKCTGCSHTTAKVAHTLEQKKDANGHWDECTAAGCDYATEPTAHDMVTKYNDEHHWSICKTCAYTDGTAIPHTMAEKTENGETWMQCTGCNHTEGKTLMLGDVNLDGIVDANDLTALARHVAEIDFLSVNQALLNGDVTRDGVVDAEDLTMLARYVAEIIDSFE